MELIEHATERADSAEVFEIESNSIPVQFESGELESLKYVETNGAALRVIDDGKLGFSTTTNWEDPSQAVERAVETAEFGEKAGFEFPGPTEVKIYDTMDREISDLTAADLIDYGKRITERLEEFDSDLEVNLDLNKSHDKIRVINSNNLAVEEEKTKLSLTVEIKDVSDDDIFSFYENAVAQHLEQFEPMGLVDRVIQKVKWARTESSIERGAFPVIFTPRGSLVLLVSLLAGFNGENVFQGTSPLGDKSGEQVFSKNLKLTDNGTLEGSPTRRSFDDEGLPVEQTTLMNDGTAENFLYDLQTAGLASVAPTGNGLKGGLISGADFRAAPSTSPTTLIISPGENTVGELISDIDKGLMVDQVLGLGQGNPLSGEFSNNISVAYKIEGGEITGKVKNTMIAGNVYDLLNGKIKLGKEAEWVGGSLKSPAIVVNDVNVVQKG
ncbi:TldD/PmbA family protein [Candidatus Bipolaricaulota bacterium]|nr:TldD/PmbA family protein [Candidatus Bipolaricaulota bacterium]